MWPVWHKQLCQVPRCQAMQTFEGKQVDLKVNPFTQRQPMQVPEDWHNMFMLVSSGDPSGSSVLNQAQATDLVVRKTMEQGIARVQAQGNKRMHKRFCSMWCEIPDYFANVVNVEPARPADSTDLHAPWSQQSNMTPRLHTTSLDTICRHHQS